MIQSGKCFNESLSYSCIHQTATEGHQEVSGDQNCDRREPREDIRRDEASRPDRTDEGIPQLLHHFFGKEDYIDK